MSRPSPSSGGGGGLAWMKTPARALSAAVSAASPANARDSLLPTSSPSAGTGGGSSSSGSSKAEREHYSAARRNQHILLWTLLVAVLLLGTTFLLQLLWVHSETPAGIHTSLLASRMDAGSAALNALDFSAAASTPPTLRVLTYATHAGYKFCMLLSSCQAQDLPLVTLGWHTQHKGLGYKLLITLQYLETLAPDDIVIFVDAFDVIMTRPEKEILETFARMNSSLVFSAEKGCWPYVAQKGGAGLCNFYYPDSPTMYKFVNTGSWIGRAGAARRLLADIAAAHASEQFGELNDQELVTDFFVCDSLNARFKEGGAAAVIDRVGRVFGDTDAHIAAARIPGCKLTGEVKYGVTLDYQCALFQSLHNSEVDQSIHAPQGQINNEAEHTNMNVHVAFDPEAGTWRNHVTNTHPAVFHFNGGGKNHIEVIWSKVKQRRRGDTRALRSFDVNTMTYSNMSYTEICQDTYTDTTQAA